MAAPHRVRIDNLIANTQSNNQRKPSQEEIDQFTFAMIHRFPGDYNTLLTDEGLVINPANPDDPLDIGTLADPEDPTSTFTPATNNQKLDVYAAQMINKTREFWDNVHTPFFVDVGDVNEDDVGNQVKDAAQRLADTAKAQSALIIGTPEDDLPADVGVFGGGTNR